jgi:hypothetical protein
MWHPNSERAQLRDTADRFPALARRKFVSRILISRRGFKHFAGNSFAAGLWRAVFLVDPLAAPCRGERERPFRASCALCIVAIADHDHLRRVASAFSHGGHVFVLFPVQAFSALSIKRTGYEGFHRGFSLGTGAKSGAIKAAQLGLDVKSRGVLRPGSAREALVER